MNSPALDTSQTTQSGRRKAPPTQDVEAEPFETAAGQWVQSTLNSYARGKKVAPHVLTAFDHNALWLLSRAFKTGIYNLTIRWDRAEWRGRDGLSFVLYTGGLSTYDFDHLTRLVIGAHDECIRVCLEPKAPRYMRLSMSPRDRDGDNISTRHPTIEDAISSFRGGSK